jgi:ABC-2 type transport system ATP-binding protein
MNLIAARGLCKNYGAVEALKGVDVEAAEGAITGLIGPDGAGKSSFMRIVLGLLAADGGSLELFGGKSVAGKTGGRARRGVGYMPEVFSLYTDLTVEENMRFSYRIHGGRSSGYPVKSERLYRFNRLDEFRNARAGTLSGGMKQKLALSCALMHDPRLLVLDEPTTGVDPLSRREFWSMLGELKDEGIGILVSTPYMEEALQCDSVYLVNEGRILIQGPPDELIANFAGRIIEFENGARPPQELRREVSAAWPERPVYLAGRRVHLALPPESGDGEAASLGGISGSHREIEPELEDLFLTSVLGGEAG